MDRFWHDVEDVDRTCAGFSAGRFHEESHRGGFVEEAEFSCFVLGIGRVHKDTSVKECAVDVGDHRADVSVEEVMSDYVCFFANSVLAGMRS